MKNAYPITLLEAYTSILMTRTDGGAQIFSQTSYPIWPQHSKMGLSAKGILTLLSRAHLMCHMMVERTKAPAGLGGVSSNHTPINFATY